MSSLRFPKRLRAAGRRIEAVNEQCSPGSLDVPKMETVILQIQRGEEGGGGL